MHLWKSRMIINTRVYLSFKVLLTTLAEEKGFPQCFVVPCSSYILTLAEELPLWNNFFLHFSMSWLTCQTQHYWQSRNSFLLLSPFLSSILCCHFRTPQSCEWREVAQCGRSQWCCRGTGYHSCWSEKNLLEWHLCKIPLVGAVVLL